MKLPGQAHLQGSPSQWLILKKMLHIQHEVQVQVFLENTIQTEIKIDFPLFFFTEYLRLNNIDQKIYW